MTHNVAVGVAALGLFTLLIAFAVPPAVDASQSTQTDTLEVAEGSTATVTAGLEVTANDTANDQASLDFEDIETGIMRSVTLNTTENETINLNDENVTVTLTEATNNDATIDVEYSPRYAWDDGAKTIAAQLDVILALFGFVLLVGSLGAIFE